MDHNHWFDRLNKALVHGAPRREVLRTAASLAAGCLLGGVSAIEAAKKKRKSKKNKKRKKPKRCEAARCKFYFQDPSQARACETKCRRCKKAGTEFCIHRADNRHNDLHATCCPRGKKCCEVSRACCPPDHKCCPFPNKPFPCCPPGSDCCQFNPNGCCQQGEECCGFAVGGCCAPGSRCCPAAVLEGGCCPNDQTCCPDVGCVVLDNNRDHCGACRRRCPEGWDCCGRFCHNIQNDRNNCGACGNRCAAGLTCCNGACVDLRNDINNCGRCGRACDTGLGCCAGFCYDPGQTRCCQDENGNDRGACGGSFVCCPPDSPTVCCPAPD